MNNKIALSPKEACEALGIGKTRLYELIGQGKIEARQCGRRTLILVESLRAYVAGLPSISGRG
jgi:excisionase family DNA binding protein